MVMTGRWCKWHCFTNIKYYGVPWFSYSNWWFFTAIFSNNQGVNDHLMSNGGRLWPTNPRLTNWMALGFPLSYPYIQFLILYIYLIYIYIYIPIDWCVHPKMFVAEHHKSYRCPHRSLSFLPISTVLQMNSVQNPVLHWLVEDRIPFMDCDIPQYNWLILVGVFPKLIDQLG